MLSVFPTCFGVMQSMLRTLEKPEETMRIADGEVGEVAKMALFLPQSFPPWFKENLCYKHDEACCLLCDILVESPV